MPASDSKLGRGLNDAFSWTGGRTTFWLEDAVFTQTENLWRQQILPGLQNNGIANHLYQEISETQYADHHPRLSVAYHPGSPGI